MQIGRLNLGRTNLTIARKQSRLRRESQYEGRQWAEANYEEEKRGGLRCTPSIHFYCISNIFLCLS
jgi:hypothetical protein